MTTEQRNGPTLDLEAELDFAPVFTLAGSMEPTDARRTEQSLRLAEEWALLKACMTWDEDYSPDNGFMTHNDACDNPFTWHPTHNPHATHQGCDQC